jgi:PleD family two-component response regulator
MKLKNIIGQLGRPIEFLKIKKLSNIASKNKFYKIIEHERERVNRNGHDVSMVLFDLALLKGNAEEKKNLIGRINHNIRSVDEIGWYDKQRVGIILPYTSSHGARVFSARICRSLNIIMPDSFCIVFTYPQESDFPDDSDSNTERQIEK